MERSQLKGYLDRIGVSVPETPSLEALRRIQVQHIFAIPVENLDIIQGNLPLSLDIDDLFEKIVAHRRGGLSFELNLLLADALRDLGYGVKLMSAKHPRYGHEFDHAFLMVTVPNENGEWLVDVGYTEGIPTPLLFDTRVWQGDGHDEYTFRQDAWDPQTWQLVRRRAGGKEGLVYSFDLTEHQAGEYVEQCNWFCTNPESRFTQGPFVFIQRPEGRICLTMDTVMNTRTGKLVRPVIENREMCKAVLREVFDLEVEDCPMDETESGKFGYKRIFAAIGDDEMQDAVIEEAVKLALAENAHLRFGHIVREPAYGKDSSEYPTYVQSVRERLNAHIAEKVASMNATNEVLGGEVVVMGSNDHVSVAIDTPADYAPVQLVESLVKPFNPTVVVCGDSGKSRLRSFFSGNASGYLSRKLDCEIIKVASA